MKLRPHHLLCIQKYTGKGYDESFSAHMNELVCRLKADPNEEIRLVEGTDDVCAACPHAAGGRCAAQEKVDRMDRGVLRALGLSYEQRGSWRALSLAAVEKVLQTEGFGQICADCQWMALCRNTQEGWVDGKEA